MLLQTALLYSSFFLLSNIPLYIYIYIYIYHIFFIHSSVGHPDCYHILAIINSVAVNARGHVSFQIIVFSKYVPRSGIAGSCSKSMSISLRNLHVLLHSGCANLHFHQQCRKAPFYPYPL